MTCFVADSRCLVFGHIYIAGNADWSFRLFESLLEFMIQSGYREELQRLQSLFFKPGKEEKTSNPE